MCRTWREEGAYCRDKAPQRRHWHMHCPAEAGGVGGALSLQLRSKEELGKKIKTWSVMN